MRLHHYPASANCYKVRLLLAQLGVEYERVNVDIFGGDTLTDEFARLNPARMTPVLETDGNAPLPESNAILVYLAEGTELLPGEGSGIYG
jgi:glutathione S-transferase